MDFRIRMMAALSATFLPYLAAAQTYSKTETIEYSDNLTHWVLGQVKRTTTNGAEDSRTDYDSTTALPMATYSFGQLQQAMTYNADGTMSSVKDGNGNVTQLSNYKLGIPQLIQFPATDDQPSGTSMSAVVDDLGLIRSVVDTRGAKTCYNYDAMGRLTQTQYPSEASPWICGGTWNDTFSSFTAGYAAAYGLPAGHWRQRVTTGNFVTETFYDALWRPVVKQTYDATNLSGTVSQSITRYDANGNVSYQSYPQSTTNTSVTNTWADPTKTPNALGADSTYDALNRLTSMTQGAETGVGTVKTTTRYLDGFKTEVTDPNSNVTTTAFMAFDEPTTDWPVQIDAPEGVHQTIARDAYGKPLSITQYGLYGTESDKVIKSFYYDAHQRLCRMMEPESGSALTTYDGAGNVLNTATGLSVSGTSCGTIPSGTQTAYTYDAMNRLKLVQAPANTQSTSYTYDATGNVTWENSGSADWEKSYNHRNMITSEKLHMVGTDARVLTYGYDGNGNVSNLIYPGVAAGAAGEKVSFVPDFMGRPTQAVSSLNRTYASAVSYWPNDQVRQFILGNGKGYVSEQNDRKLLSSFAYGDGSTTQLGESEIYDRNGNILTVTDQVDSTRNKVFQYDGLNRLTSAVANGLWGSEKYTYDALNNLRTRLSGGYTLNYTIDAANRLSGLSIGSTPFATYQYDDRGNRNMVTSGGVSTNYLFDAKNQLIQIPTLDSYRYDASGRRVQKSAAGGGASVFYLYNGAGQLMYQFVPGESQATNFIHLGTRLIADDVALVLSSPGAVVFDSNPNNGSYTVTWGAVAKATSYTLQESVDGGASWNTVYTGNAASFSFSGRDGGSYVYQVQANGNDDGQVVHSGWTLSATLGVTPKVPAVSGPTTLVFGPYTVNWTTSVGVSGYDVQESLDGGAWATIASNTTATSIVRPGTVGGNYTYRVMAKNAYGNRGWSASIAVAVTQIPDVPTNVLPVTGSDGTYVQLNWDAKRFATMYMLTQYRTGIHLGFQAFVLTNNSYIVPHLPPNGVIFELKACSIAGCSAVVRLGGDPTLTPTVPTVTGPATLVFGTYTVSWTAQPIANAYDVEEKLGDGVWVNIASHTAATSISRQGTTGGSYQYEVSAWNGAGSRGWSIPITVAVTQVPDTPTNFIFGTDGGGHTTLTWDAMPFATSYKLTVVGVHGTLGTYNYKVGDPSFVVPLGNYQVATLAACSIAGCSTPAQVTGGTGLGNTAMKSKAKPRGMDAGSSTESSGCTETNCQAIIGGTP